MAKKKIDGVTYDIMEGVRVNEYGAAFKILQGKYGEDVCFNTLEPTVVETYEMTFENILSLERDHSSGWRRHNEQRTWAALYRYTNDTQYIEFGCDTNILPDGARIQSVIIIFKMDGGYSHSWGNLPKRATYTYNNQIQNLQVDIVDGWPSLTKVINVNDMSKDAFSRNRFRFEYDDSKSDLIVVPIKTMKFVVRYTLTEY